MKWTIIDSKKSIKARLTVRGFKDRQAQQGGIQTFAGTTSRWGQRLVCSVAALRGWRLRSADISMAFLRGLTFETISKRTGQPIRSIQFDLPPGAASILRMIPGYENFDPATETLEMLKPGFGTVGAPRAWAMELLECLHHAGF